MKYKYKCNKCGFTNITTNNDEVVCKLCNNAINKEICNIESKSESHYIHEIKINIINEDINALTECIDALDKINSDNIYCKIYKSNDKLDEWLKYQTIDNDLDLIFRYDLLKTYDKSILLEHLANSSIDKKEQYIRLLNNNLDESDELLDKVNNIKADYYIIRKEKININALAYLLLGVALVFSFVMIIVGNTMIPKDCNYACIILLDIIPSILITLSILKFIKLEKLYIGIPLFLIIFLLTSYLFTINMHQGGFIESINYHFERIIYSFSDIAKSINANIDSIPDEVEASL